MSGKPWHVQDGDGGYEASFKTLSEAEAFAKKSVRIIGYPREILHQDDGPWRHVASVRRDALGRVWVDIMDSTLA